MLFSSWLRNWKRSAPAASLRRRARFFRPLLDILEDRTLPSAYMVNSLTDTGSGSGLAGDLRYCITNATSGSDTITFEQGLSGTIQLQSPLPTLNASVDIQGPGAGTLTVIPTYTPSPNSQADVFSVGSAANVQISGLTLSTGSNSKGGVGAIGNAGTVTVSACTIADFTNNGYVINEGTMTLSGCTLTAAPIDSIEESGSPPTLTVSNSTLSDLSNIDSIDGAATITACAFTDSWISSQGNPGLPATLTVSYTTLSGGNSMIGNSGGTATVSYCTVSGNTTCAIYNGNQFTSTGSLTIDNSTIANNSAIGNKAYSTVAGSTSYSFAAGNAMGGGIYTSGGTLSINSSTIADNQAIGGSSAGLGAGYAGNGYGGGLYIAGGTVSINNSTLADNQALNGASRVRGAGTAYGGGIYNAAGAGALHMYDTILGGNSATTAAPDLDGSLTSLGHNLIGTSYGNGYAASDLLNANPALGPLQNNGGPTETMALLPGSPAIDAGDNTNAPAYDQRGPGHPRIVDGTIEIGAFEVQAPSTIPAISQVSPDYGPTMGGAMVTITGDKLGTASTATVDFGSNNPATIVSDNGSQLVVAEPAGSGTVDVTVTTADGTSATSSDQFTYVDSLTLSPSTLAAATADEPYSATIIAGGGSGSYAFALASGSFLPAGLTLSSSGTLAGITRTAGSYTFTVVASDTVFTGVTGSQQYTLTVNPCTLTVTLSPTSLPAATAGQPYSVTFTASGGSGSYTFGLGIFSEPPAGMSLDSLGILFGTAPAPGSYTFTIVASDTVYSLSGSQQYTLTVNPVRTLTLSPTALPTATVGDSYGPVTITASGGSDSYTFALAAGSKLPAGLTLTSAGVLSGKPSTTTGSPFNFTITATDKSNSGLTGSAVYTLTVDPAITLSPTTLPVATVGNAVNDKLTAKGGSGAAYTFALASASSLPAGLTLTSDGIITGTPTRSGKYAFTIVASDSTGATRSQAYSLTVDPAITIKPTTLPAATIGRKYTESLTASGGSGTGYSWSASGLPAWLTLSRSGTLSGTPPQSAPAHITFTVTVSDSDKGTDVVQFTLSINA